MKKEKIILVVLIAIIWFMVGNLVNADSSIEYNPDANISYTLNVWTNTESGFTAWTITITNWTGVITILDRNLWAINNDINSTWSYWYHFQWWNNYWFRLCYLNYCEDFPWWEDIKYVWDYGPIFNSSYNNKWYFWNIYISSDSSYQLDYWRDSNAQLHNGLWWWSWDVQSNNYWLDLYNYLDRQWPCPEWWHVPNAWEWSKLVDYWSDLYKLEDPLFELQSSWWLSLFENNINASLSLRSSLKLPYAGVTTTYRVINLWEVWFYASSTPNIESWLPKYYVLWLWINNTVWWAASYAFRWYWLSIRCFKNIYPNRNSSGNSEIVVNIAAFNWWKNTCTGENYIFSWIVAGPSLITRALTKTIQCAFWESRATSVTIQLSWDLVDENGNTISSWNVKIKNSARISTPLWVKSSDNVIATYTWLNNTITLFNKAANVIWTAEWSWVDIQLEILWWTPNGTYNWTLVLTY